MLKYLDPLLTFPTLTTKMMIIGILPQKELATLFPASEDTPPHLVVEVGGERLKFDTLCPPGRYLHDDPEAPWNVLDSDRDPSSYLDDNGEPLLLETPTIVPLVKLPKPEDTLTHYSEPKLVWFDDRVERDWEVLPIPQPTEEERASDAAKKAAAAAAAEKRRLLYLDFEVQPEGFSIATKEDDQNAFSRLHTLVTAANLPDSTEISISDSLGTLHNITVARFKEIIVAYGLEIFERWTKYR